MRRRPLRPAPLETIDGIPIDEWCLMHAFAVEYDMTRDSTLFRFNSRKIDDMRSPQRFDRGVDATHLDPNTFKNSSTLATCTPQTSAIKRRYPPPGSRSGSTSTGMLISFLFTLDTRASRPQDEHTMKNITTIALLILSLSAAACGDNHLPTPRPTADAGPVESPTCDLCNGPGCEDLDAACVDVESQSRAVVCDAGADPTELGTTFTTYDARGRTVTCLCDDDACAPGGH